MAEPTRCPACLTRDFCSCLSHDDVERLLDRRLPHAYRRGQAIFYEGNPALAVYLVGSGRVKLFRRGNNGDEYTVGTRGAGDLIGVRAALCSLPYPVTAEPLESSMVCTIPRESFVHALHESPGLALKLLARISQESRTAEDHLVARCVERVSQRTARFLLDFAKGENVGSDFRVRLPVGMSREEMARWIGTAPETLSRTLHEFAAQGIVELAAKKEIVVRDPSSLRRLAERGDVTRCSPPHPPLGAKNTT